MPHTTAKTRMGPPYGNLRRPQAGRTARRPRPKGSFPRSGRSSEDTAGNLEKALVPSAMCQRPGPFEPAGLGRDAQVRGHLATVDVDPRVEDLTLVAVAVRAEGTVVDDERRLREAVGRAPHLHITVPPLAPGTRARTGPAAHGAVIRDGRNVP